MIEDSAMINSKEQQKSESDVDILEEFCKIKKLVLYNDDVNSFEYVILSLIEICSFSQVQAEQCTTIAHFNGKCPLIEGDYEVLHPMYIALQNRQLTVEIS